MSITIADILKLPSLSQAKVAAGAAGLNRVVSSISVLEYANPVFLNDELFKNDEFYGSEIVITGLISAKDDVETQCNSIRRLHEAGEVGMILYYIGIFLPQVDRRLITLCDELGFTLICMPEKRMDLRYSEVITEVMTAIIKDQMKDPYLVGEMLERITGLPEHQRTMNTVLRLLSDRVRTSLFLADGDFRLLNSAAWPMSGNIQFDKIKAWYHSQISRLPAAPQFPEPNKNICIAAEVIHDEANADMYLIAARENDSLSPETSRQIAEVVRLFTGIWGKGHGNIATEELVKAILNDEPAKMRRLADIFSVDVRSIDNMILIVSALHPDGILDHAELEMVLNLEKCTMEPFYNISICGSWQGYCLAFTGQEKMTDSGQNPLETLSEALAQAGLSMILIGCPGLESTSDVRASFLMCQQYISQARRIYPEKKIMTVQEICFSKSCQDILDEGEKRVKEVLRPAICVQKDDETGALYHTLETYLLDAQTSVTRTSELLYVHKNTIKYRISKINEILHMQVGRMPEVYGLYLAAAVNRLLEDREDI